MAEQRRRTAVPMLVAAVAVVAVLAGVITARSWAGQDRANPAPSRDPSHTPTGTQAVAEPVSIDVVDEPVSVGGDLFVGGEQVPGRWYHAEGLGTHWIALREDRTWWWGYDELPQPMDGEMEQPPVISPSGGYTARVVRDHGGRMLVGADTQWAGEGFGGIELPGIGNGAPPRAVAVTDDGLVVARGAKFQWLWRPLLDGGVIDLAQTAPGQVVLGSTDAGLIVTQGTYAESPDANLGEPYLALLSPEGSLARLVTVPNHGSLEASNEWMAYVPPGVIGGETWGTSELQVRRLDGSSRGVLTAPDGWLFADPGYRWESSHQLLAVVFAQDGGAERLVRCRPDATECEFLDQV